MILEEFAADVFVEAGPVDDIGVKRLVRTLNALSYCPDLAFAVLLLCLQQHPAASQDERRAGNGEISEVHGIFSPDPLVRIDAFLAIQRHSWTDEQAATISHALAKKLDDNEDISATCIAIAKLSRAHAAASMEAVRALERQCDISRVRRHDMTERGLCSTLQAFGRLDPAIITARSGVQEIAYADGELPYASTWAAGALAKLYPEESEWLGALLERFKTQPTHVLLAALGEIGPTAKEAIPQLRSQLKPATSASMKTLAAVAIVRIDESEHDAMFRVLANEIQHPASDVVLEPFGPSPSGLDHREYIVGALGDMNSTEMRQSIIRHFQPLQSEACPELRRSLDLILEQAVDEPVDGA